MTEREVLTWERYGEAAGLLSKQVLDSGFVPDVVLGIARGGLVPAASVAYAIGCKNLFTMNVEFYTGEGTTLDAPIFLPPLLDAADLEDLTVLVVDDVADSGETLKLVTDFCRPRAAEVRSAVLYEKPRTIVRPHYAWKRTDLWIDFPWSSNLP